MSSKNKSKSSKLKPKTNGTARSKSKPKTNKKPTNSNNKGKKSNKPNKASTKSNNSLHANTKNKSSKSPAQPHRRSTSATPSKPKKSAGHKNRHAPNAKDELFLKLLSKAPELKQWLQREGIWIQELFEILVKDYKVNKEAHIAQKITSNDDFDDLIRKVKLQRMESNKNADELRRLTLNLLKFEKCWRAMTGISRKNAPKVKISKPAAPTPSTTTKKEAAPPRRRADSLPKQPKPKPKPKPKTSPKMKAPPKPAKMTKSKSVATTTDAKSGNSSSSSGAKCQELEKDAFAYCNDADKCTENGLYQKAVKFYSFGILALKKTLGLIKSESDQQSRSQQIDGYKAKKGQVQFTLNKDRLKRRQNEHKGMEFCLQAEQYEKKGAFDAAMKYYEKGLPFLKKSVENMEHSLTKQYKWNRIMRYKANLNECRQQNGKKSKTKSAATAAIDEHGLLHYVAQGTMDIDVIERANDKDLYLSLPFLISSMALIPISFKQCFRDPFLKRFNERIESLPMLEQQLKCYLFSYSLDRNVYYNASVKSIYRYHPCMPQLAYDDHDSDDEKQLGTDFASYYQDRDCISFFRSVANNMGAIAKLADKLSDTSIRKAVDDDIVVYDLFGDDCQLRALEILKVFKSNAKPVLVRALTDDVNTHFQYILKNGDDLRRDNGIMAMFKLMNYFWWKRGLRYEKRFDVHCLIYNIVPMGNDFGILEYIDGCVPISEISKLSTTNGAKDDREAFLRQLVCTAAGAYIASFVCGIRDRHYDNILIRKSDGTLFHIDFNYLWTKVGFLDASKMAITKDLKLFLGEHHWNGFVNIAVHAYLVLREHFNEIVSFSTIAFDFIEMNNSGESVRPQQYLYNQLRMDLDDDKAQEYITKKLENAPNNIKTKLKNAMHKLATT